jgi:NADH-quinone oxidoreductase subunit G
MPKLKIDGCETEVPKGMKVIEAAARLGIIIPRFCYHPGLGSVGACRMCAVKFIDGPVKGIQMSCMVEAADGMVVSTTDGEAVDFRRQVIEWLMMNHPHDCPVCDEGGHCLLQDMTVAGGHGIRRYQGKKRTYRDQDLGPLVQHEMNRCIHCWRCRRFYQEFAGYRDLGAMQIAYRTYFGRYKDGPLESPFSGNLIDLCPTGVYTDKPSRFKGRRWDYVRSPSLCIHCSLGCHVIASVRYREVVRLEASFNGAVNGYFICDRGRHGFAYANHPERPRRPKVGPDEISWNESMTVAGRRLQQIAQQHGHSSVACFGSARGSLETQGMLKRLCRQAGWRGPVWFVDGPTERKVRSAVARLEPDLARSMGEIEKADFIIVAGADPVNEAPMLALAMRQAHRQGAMTVVIDPRPVSLPFPFDHFALAPREIDFFLATFVKKAVTRSAVEQLGEAALRFFDAIPGEFPAGLSGTGKLAATSDRLQQSRNPVIICGTQMVGEATPHVAADCALFLTGTEKKAGLFYVMPGANAFGAGLLSDGNDSLTELIESIERGGTKALVVVESDPFYLFPDQDRLETAMQKLEFLLVMDYLPSKSSRLAHVFLPTLPVFEAEDIFVNQEGRAQSVAKVHPGGTPVEQVSAGDHPPRVFRSDIPGGDPRAAWEALAELSRVASVKGVSRGELWPWLAEVNPVFKGTPPVNGDRLLSSRDTESAFVLNRMAAGGPDPGKEGGLDLLLVDWTFGTEELSQYSDSLQQVEKAPYLSMNRKDAGKLGLKDGDRIILSTGEGAIEVNLYVGENVASGVMVLPRHRQISWQKVKSLREWVPFENIKKK